MFCSTGISSSPCGIFNGRRHAAEGRWSERQRLLNALWKHLFTVGSWIGGFERNGIRATLFARRISRTLRAHRIMAVVLAVVASLPMALAPSHPLSVYAFLAQRYAGCLFATGEGGNELSAFLTSEVQVARYREEICGDMRDSSGGMIFAIVRARDGGYRHVALRTWNALLPDALAQSLGTYMDYKEIPYLGDEVALWLRGEAIVAMGHYHPFGGGPSRGDRLARRFSATSEVVVSNGLIPFIYLDGALLSYGDAGQLNTDVFRCIRMMEKSLTMALGEVPVDAGQPTAGLRTFLAYLKESRHVDIWDKAAIGAEVTGLCDEFRRTYAPAFTAGFSPSSYPGDLDRASMLGNLSSTEMWARSLRAVKVASVRRRNRMAGVNGVADYAWKESELARLQIPIEAEY